MKNIVNSITKYYKENKEGLLGITLSTQNSHRSFIGLPSWLPFKGRSEVEHIIRLQESYYTYKYIYFSGTTFIKCCLQYPVIERIVKRRNTIPGLGVEKREPGIPGSHFSSLDLDFQMSNTSHYHAEGTMGRKRKGTFTLLSEDPTVLHLPPPRGAGVQSIIGYKADSGPGPSAHHKMLYHFTLRSPLGSRGRRRMGKFCDCCITFPIWSLL